MLKWRNMTSTCRTHTYMGNSYTCQVYLEYINSIDKARFVSGFRLREHFHKFLAQSHCRKPSIKHYMSNNVEFIIENTITNRNDYSNACGLLSKIHFQKRNWKNTKQFSRIWIQSNFRTNMSLVWIDLVLSLHIVTLCWKTIELPTKCFRRKFDVNRCVELAKHRARYTKQSCWKVLFRFNAEYKRTYGYFP